MFVKLFSGLLLATGIVAASAASHSATVPETCSAKGTCCSADCCKDCPNCSCKCECCQGCANGCKCPNMKK